MDEPTTALDVTTQTHVLRMVKSLAARHRTAILYVSHDLAVVASLADRVAVMYSGEIVEAGASAQVLGEPLHPYTRALIRAVPDPDRPIRLEGLGGHAPEPYRRPAGCSFAPRCPIAEARCSAAPLGDTAVAPGHVVRCLRPDSIRLPSRRPRRSCRCPPWQRRRWSGCNPSRPGMTAACCTT
jgi:peptide/nickel transport system ATP-binding protein